MITAAKKRRCELQQVYNMIETENNVELEDEVIEAAEYSEVSVMISYRSGLVPVRRSCASTVLPVTGWSITTAL